MAEKEQIVREIFADCWNVTDEGMLQQMTQISEVKTFAKKQILLREGAVATEVYLIYEGVLRAYSFNEKGADLTACFAYKKGIPMLGINSLTDLEPATVTLQAVTEATVLSIKLPLITEFIKNYPVPMYTVYLDMLEQVRSAKVKMAVMRSMQNRERCIWLKENHPDLIPMVKKKYLASYLNMTLSNYCVCMKELS